MPLAWLLVALCAFPAVPLRSAASAPAAGAHAGSDAVESTSQPALGRSLLQSACGDKGQACCSGVDNAQRCGAGSSLLGSRACSSDSGGGTCLACGGVGEVCCQRRASDDPECARGAVCAGGQCEPCGRFGERCCAGSRACVFGSCSSGRCATAEADCGELGQPCCFQNFRPGVAGGGLCSRDTIAGGQALRCSDSSGTCIACGGTGEACCETPRASFGVCKDNNICSDSGDPVCVACGELGEPCCQRSSGGALFCSGGASGSAIECDTGSGCCGTTSCEDTSSFPVNPPVTLTPLPPTVSPRVDPPVRTPDPAPVTPAPRPPVRTPVPVPVRPAPVAPSPSPPGVTVTLPDPADGSAGAAAIGIALDASAFLTEAEFNTVRDQVVAFIDRSSEVTTAGVANANVYYVMTYTSTSRAISRLTFITNANRAVSSRVERFAWLGSLVGQDQGLLAVALNALAERFEGLSLAASASAVVISASDGARNTPTTADALEAGDRLRASYSAPVSIATVALTSSESTQLVRRVVSRDVQLNRLSVSTTVLARVEAVLTSLTSTTGGVAIAIALDTSSAVSESEFLTARSQLISFIDSSSGVNTEAGVNRNIYYLNAFSTSVRSSTRVWLSNADRQVSRLVEQFFVYRGGSINLAAGIDDLTAQISGLTVSVPALALVVAAGSSSRTAAVSAASRLSSSYEGRVSLGCVALGSAFSANVATLAAIASTGLDGNSLSLRASSFSSIATQCTSVLDSLDVDGDGTTDTADVCFADAAKIQPARCGCGFAETPDCGVVSGCRGNLDIAIALDSSASIGEDDFEVIKEQVVAFIDATSFPTSVTGTEPSLIRYYVNAFSNGVTSDTITFLTNTFRLAANEVEDNIAFSGGSTDIASGINDLTDIFEFVNRTDDRAGLAIVVTDGRASRSEAEAAADALRAEGVTVAAVGFGDEVDLATLEAVASVGRDGTKLVFTAFVFEDIAGLFAAALQRVDSDSDGVDDCRDSCPTDSAKTAPGLCGCGFPETCPR